MSVGSVLQGVTAQICFLLSGRLLFRSHPLLPCRHRVRPVPHRCDKSTTCPGKSTCCKTASGGWACCPLSQAVCCDDHVHCCPHSKVCNLAAETCDDPFGFSPPLSWLTKVPALTSEAQDEKCDEKTRCPWGSTCCKKNSGQWACCPLPLLC
uniref:Granulin b n=1 Tax=Amphilophus citrinellus TaxID=61819 RepID=A0A3Q0S496_AMPCI